MAKPDWMVERENRLHIKFKQCIDCCHVGEPCGQTNNLGHGRKTRYRCRLHPTVILYNGMLACVDYEYGPTGAT